jgi:hypothetical protein
MPTQSLLRMLGLSALLLMLPPLVLFAQMAPPPPELLPLPPAPPVGSADGGTSLPPAAPCNCYQGFDTTFGNKFLLGAHYNVPGFASVARDSLHLDFTQFYHWIDVEFPSKFMNPGLWPPLSGPFGDPHTRWADSISKAFVDDMIASDLKMVNAPGHIQYLSSAAEVSEAYYNHDTNYIHTAYFDLPPQASVVDSIRNYYAWGGAFPRIIGPSSPVLMDGRPTYTIHGMGTGGYYSSIGDTVDEGATDLALAIKADQLNLIGDSDLVAYAQLYRRVALGQNDCKCDFFAPIDSLAITKLVYQSPSISDSNAGSGYRDVTFTLHLDEESVTPATTIRIVRDTGDTVTAVSGGVSQVLYRPRWELFPAGVRGNESAPGCQRYCKRLLDSLKAHSLVPQGTIDTNLVAESDIIYDVFTTNKVPVTFLRGRFAPRTYTLIRQGRFDSFINDQVDQVYNDTNIRKIQARIGITDEQWMPRFKAYQEIGSRVARRMLVDEPSGTRGLWTNPKFEHAPLRVLSGDLDTTGIKMIHMMATQIYNIYGPMPVMYVNPDSMKNSSALAAGKYYDARNGVVIAYNTTDNHRIYDSLKNVQLKGKIDQMVDAVNVSRFKFRHIRSESYPVYLVAQVHGDLAQDGGGYWGSFSSFRPTTPEEITAQSWLALNCGVDGLVFSDFAFDGAGEFGVMNSANGDHSQNYYTGLNLDEPGKKGVTSWTLPLMWTGFHDRFNAVRRVTDDFTNNILPVYNKLDRNGTRMSVDSGVSFAQMPLIDTLYTRWAQPRKVGGVYVDGTTIDPQSATYIEATVFKPGPSDTNTTSQYLLVTNMRCWPYDTLRYSTYVDTVGNSHSSRGNVDTGFGAIDVRRPIIKLKKTPGLICDSYQIKRIGDTTWRTVPADTTVELDWLDPGWGAMYQIRPLGISKLGTAYNNAVRSENLTRDSLDTAGGAHFVVTVKHRIVVYERDSAIYLRTLDTAGKWSGEVMVSDAADVVRDTTRTPVPRHANNMFPAVATVRDKGAGTSGPQVLVVWERDDSGSVTTEARFFKTADCSIGQSSRLRLSATRAMWDGVRMTPAVAGHDSGWVVAWAAPVSGIEAVSVRNPVGSGMPSPVTDISTVLALRAPGALVGPGFPLDTLAEFPSLASAHYHYQFPNGSRQREFHLAFRQGGANGHYIFYLPLRAWFPTAKVKPGIAASGAMEHVSAGIGTCLFDHPSIAADSLNVAVAFESKFNVLAGHLISYDPSGSSGGAVSSAVTLRFRNIFNSAIGGNPPSPWKVGQTYYWRDAISTQEYPSVTEFPQRPRWKILAEADGGVSWIRTLFGKQTSEQRVYRFGETAPYRLTSRGKFPTMMLVPYVGGAPFGETGVLYRGDDTAKTAAERTVLGGLAWYYPPYLHNSPTAVDSQFIKPLSGGNTITATLAFYDTLKPATPCRRIWATAGLKLPTPLLRHGTSTHQDTTQPGLPPLFFAPPDTGASMVLDTVTKLSMVTRSSVFTVTTAAVDVHRMVAADDSVLTWLNDAPYDSTLNSPGDVFILTELVRASDDSVIWYAPPVSMRSVDTTMLDEIVHVPTDSVASPGTQVYLRLRPVPTAGLTYDMEAGFSFSDDTLVTDDGFQKVVLPTGQRTSSASVDGLRAIVIPNPAHDQAELRLHAIVPGKVRVAIYDMLGRQVRVMPEQGIGRAGDYVMRLDLDGLVSGRYTVQVEQGHDRAATQVVVMR